MYASCSASTAAKKAASSAAGGGGAAEEEEEEEEEEEDEEAAAAATCLAMLGRARFRGETMGKLGGAASRLLMMIKGQLLI